MGFVKNVHFEFLSKWVSKWVSQSWVARKWVYKPVGATNAAVKLVPKYKTRAPQFTLSRNSHNFRIAVDREF